MLNGLDMGPAYQKIIQESKADPFRPLYGRLYSVPTHLENIPYIDCRISYFNSGVGQFYVITVGQFWLDINIFPHLFRMYFKRFQITN